MSDETLPGTEPAPEYAPVLSGTEAMVAVAMSIASDCIRSGVIFRVNRDVTALQAGDAMTDLVRRCLPVVARGVDVVYERLRAGAEPPVEGEEE